MEKQDQKIEKKVIRSVVVVREDGGIDCCTGFVAEIEEDGTIYVLTQSMFVKGKVGPLKVCFFDKIEATATIVQNRPPLCLLRAGSHSKCKKIEWAESCNVDIDRVLLFPPPSPAHYKRISAFVSLESLESYEKSSVKYVDGSGNFFMISCPYTEKTMDGHNMLVAAPVFNEKGAIGVVFMDGFAHMGAEMKIVVCVKAMVQLLSELIPPSTSKGSGKLEDLRPKKRRRVKRS